jgi:hypothetical protein
MRAAAALIALGACGRHEHGAIDRERAAALFDLVEIHGAPPGLSDLVLDPDGPLWTIAERDRSALEVTLAGAVTPHPLDGIPDGVDTEALAALGGGRFAIGTEGADDPTAAIVFAERRGDRLVATRTRPLTSAELGVTLTVNHGVEGICGHGDDLIAAIESVGMLPDGTRWAPLARLAGDRLTVTKLRLTSQTGKISALTCAFAADGTVHALAIERHYGVSRILRFDLTAGATEVTPTVALDLGPVLRDSLNLEGLAVLPDGRLVAINDNQGRTVDGPSELLVFRPNAVR